MMFKKLLSFVGLGVFALTSAAAGVLLASSPKASEVKADEPPKTWMFRAQLDLGECSPHTEEPVFDPSVGVIAAKLHCWGDNLNEFYDAGYMFYQTFDYYGVNVSFSDDQVIRGMQWIITQDGGVGDKYSENIEKFGAEDVTQIDKDSDIAIIQHQFTNNWDGEGHWHFSNVLGYTNDYIRLEVGVGEYDYYYLEKQPASNTFAVKGLALDNDAFSIWAGGQIAISNRALFDEKSLEYIYGGTDNWWYIRDGEFDFILRSGELALRKNVEDLIEIYLVDIAEDAYIYSFGEGGEEEFGAFPGTMLSDITEAGEITGDLKFQDHSWKIWSLCLHAGYPTADHIIISYLNEHGHVGNQTADMLLKNGSAYWFSYDADYHNDDAGKAIWFLEMAESFRIDATDESICNISAENAAVIVSDYNNLSNDIRTTYVDCTKVNTYKRDGSEGKEYVEYRYVMEELAAKYDLDLVSSSRPVSTSGSVTITTIVGIVTIIAVASISALFIVVTLKKKHE